VIIEALRSACQRRSVPDLDRAIDAYITVGTLNAGDRAVLDGLVEAGDRGGKVLAYLRGRLGDTAMQIGFIAYLEHIGGGPVPRG
jgi:hypothetical protein